MLHERENEYRPFVRRRGRLARQLIDETGQTPLTQTEVFAFDQRATAAIHEEVREHALARLATMAQDDPNRLVIEVLLDERPLLTNAAMRAGRRKYNAEWAEPRRTNSNVTTSTGVELRIEERAPVELLKATI
jgi:hypothetical protein